MLPAVILLKVKIEIEVKMAERCKGTIVIHSYIKVLLTSFIGHKYHLGVYRCKHVENFLVRLLCGDS